MKNVASISKTADIRNRRRSARRAQRVIASNFRSAARNADTGPIQLGRSAHIRAHRVLLAWCGIRIMMPDVVRLAGALNMSLEDVFRGTKSAA